MPRIPRPESALPVPPPPTPRPGKREQVNASPQSRARYPAALAGTRDSRTAVELRIAGHSPGEIAKVMEIAPAKVRELIDGYLREHPMEGTEEIRAVILHRYEQLWQSLQDRLESGSDDDAIASALKVLEAVRKVSGADAPVKVDATVTHTTVMPEDIPLANRIRALENASKARAAAAMPPEERGMRTGSH